MEELRRALASLPEGRIQAIISEVTRIARTHPVCKLESMETVRNEMATAIYVQRVSGFTPIGRDKYGILRPLIGRLGQLIVVIETVPKEEWSVELKKIIDNALADRRWVWEHPILVYR